MSAPLLEIRNLHATAGGKEVLRGVNLTVPAGELHFLLGPNGAGKSTLAALLGGAPGYVRTAGTVLFQDKEMADATPVERAQQGFFLGFQNPPVLAGVRMFTYLQTILQEQRKAAGKPPWKMQELLPHLLQEVKAVGWDASFLQRPVHYEFSGGEKKRSELLQMALLQPTFALLDEADSGLDLDGLQLLAARLRAFPSLRRSLLLITHYPQLLEQAPPHRVHILSQGRIVASGTQELAQRLLQEGYASFLAAHPPTHHG